MGLPPYSMDMRDVLSLLLLCFLGGRFFRRGFFRRNFGSILAAVRFHRQGHDGAVGGAGLCGCALGYYPAGAVASNWTLRLEAFSIWDAKLPLLPVTSGTVVMASWSVLVYR